jgi:hypothetical protein
MNVSGARSPWETSARNRRCASCAAVSAWWPRSSDASIESIVARADRSRRAATNPVRAAVADPITVVGTPGDRLGDCHQPGQRSQATARLLAGEYDVSRGRRGLREVHRGA